MIAMVVLFRVGYEQSGNVIALWVRDFTDRHVNLLGLHATIPATWFQSINPLLIIVGTPVLIRIWRGRKARETTAHLLRRMAIGCLIAAAAMFDHGSRSARERSRGRAGELALGLCLFRASDPWRAVRHSGRTDAHRIACAGPLRVDGNGGWYIAKFLGSLLAGIMGAYWLVIPAWAFFFLGMVSTLIAAISLYSMSRLLRSSAG